MPVTNDAMASARDRRRRAGRRHESFDGRVDVSLTVDGDVRRPLRTVEVPVFESPLRVSVPAGRQVRILPFHRVDAIDVYDRRR